MKTLLIIGGSSFIGKNLLNKLKKKYLIYATYYKKEIINKHNIKTSKFDINNPDLTIFNKKIDAIIFLSQPIITNNKNLKHFLKNLKILKKKIIQRQISKLIYFSSGSVYEKNYNKLSLNAKTKKAAEKILFNSNKKYKIIILRIFFPYGKNQKNRLLPKLFQNLKRKKINILDNNYNIFPTHVDDIVKVVKKVLTNNKYEGIYNVFNYKEKLSMFEICKIVLKKEIVKKIFVHKKINNLNINYSFNNLLFKKKVKLFKSEYKSLL